MTYVLIAFIFSFPSYIPTSTTVVFHSLESCEKAASVLFEKKRTNSIGDVVAMCAEDKPQ